MSDTLAGDCWARRADHGREAPLDRHLPASLLACLVALADMLALGLGGLVGPAAVFGRGHPAAANDGVLLLMVPLAIAFGAWRGAYRHPVLYVAKRQLQVLLPATTVAWAWALLGASACGVLGMLEVGPLLAAMFFGASLLILCRASLALVLRGRIGERAALRVVLLGHGSRAVEVAEYLRQCGDRSLRLLGVLDDRHGWTGASLASDLPHLGTAEELFHMIQHGEVDQILVTNSTACERDMTPLLQRLADQPVDICLVLELLDHQPGQDGVRASGIRLVHLVVRPVSGWGGVIKTAEDYILAVTALAVVAGPMVLIMLAIWLDSPGPVLFRQPRIGFRCREFEIFKFRTMYHHAADPTGLYQARDGDPRITRVGAILRRTSFDELPQIFNVLRGEMSLVGPRPHAPDTRAGNRRFDEVVARYAARHRVKPGLTGLAQVRGWRGPTDIEEKLVRRVESDLEYIENWSVWLDLAILLRTLVAVARMRNAC